MELDRAIAEQIVNAGGETVSRLGLRFDRVVMRVLGDLRRFAAGKTPAGASVILTLTAPIRMPAKTIRALELEIEALLRAELGDRDRIAEVCSNAVRLRLVEHAPTRDHLLVGFVHNRDSDAWHLVDLAEQWLRSGK